jgi:Phosphoadenosine phosphosulfate reductase family
LCVRVQLKKMYNQLNLFDDSEQIVASPLEILKSQPTPHPDCPIVVAYGGGKNSTAMLILLTKLGVKVDLILFADTGGELPETYEFIEIFSDWLKSNEQPPITTIRQKPSGVSDKRSVLIASKANLLRCLFSDSQGLLGWLVWWCGITAHAPGTLEEASLVTQTLPSQAYGKKACSVQWKIRPQNEFVDAWQPAIDAWNKGLKIRKIIGYHRDEVGRLLDKQTRRMRPLQDEQYIYEYPLMFHGIDEMGCRAIISSAGLLVPPKSSCFFCPNRSALEVEALPEELRLRGELIEQVNVDGIHHRESSVKGLGRKFAWRNIGEMTELEKMMAANTRNCQCID